jgi:hypothetical protein
MEKGPDWKLSRLRFTVAHELAHYRAVGPRLDLAGRLKVSSHKGPPLATQRAIVTEIEAEQALVAGNRELLTRCEQKIQATLARIWGEEAPATPEA